MHYCEVTPRINRGIVHLETVLFLKNCSFIYNRDSKLLTGVKSEPEATFEVKPLYRYYPADLTNPHKGSYKFEVALELSPDSFLRLEEGHLDGDNGLGSLILDSSCTDTGLLNGVNQARAGKELLRGFARGSDSTKEISLSDPDSTAWVEFLVNCRDFLILDDSLLSVDIKSTPGSHRLVFRIGINFDRRLDFLDLKISSFAAAKDFNLLNKAQQVSFRCKTCGAEVELLSDFVCLPLPSDLYLNSIGSVYCEECQDSLATTDSGAHIEDRPTNDTVVYISDEVVTVRIPQSRIRRARSDCSIGDREGAVLRNGAHKGEVLCPLCKTAVGTKESKSHSYFKRKVSAIVGGLDVFWRHSDFADLIERVQFHERVNLSLTWGAERIDIIKVTKEPDTFIFLQNNPVLTSRILYKIYNFATDPINTPKTGATFRILTEPVPRATFHHVKQLILRFSHEPDNSDWIPSLLPQL